jgi:predicted small metal-binding protein
MVKEVSCIHAGFEDCEFLVRSESDAELIDFVRTHAAETHGVSVSPEHVERIMREV